MGRRQQSLLPAVFQRIGGNLLPMLLAFAVFAAMFALAGAVFAVRAFMVLICANLAGRVHRKVGAPVRP